MNPTTQPAPTPLTDAQPHYPGLGGIWTVDREYARALERRNAELVTALEEAMRVFDELDAVSWFPDSDIGPQTYAEAERLGAAALAQPATTQAHE